MTFGLKRGEFKIISSGRGVSTMEERWREGYLKFLLKDKGWLVVHDKVEII